ncbi:cold shock domain-containing protein [Enterovibrio norvegicus]|uniref:cold shock domain-containing protein n=1 Tax=Enterovibrio norvegicus TaxID=188144 RepID=UPI0035932090
MKWFGGNNSKTGRVNDFGFIELEGDESVFVHKSSFENCKSLEEGDLVLFTKANGKKGVQAQSVTKLYAFEDNFLSLLSGVSDDELKQCRAASIAPILVYLSQEPTLKTLHNNVPFKSFLKGLCQSEFGKQFIVELSSISANKKSIAALICGCKNWEDLFGEAGFSKESLTDCISSFGYELLPPSYVTGNLTFLSEHLQMLSEVERINTLQKLNKSLSFSAALYLIFRNVAPHPELWDIERTQSSGELSLSELLKRFVEGTVTRQNQVEVDEFVRDAYKARFNSFSDYCQHPVIAAVIKPCLIKRKMFMKDMSFIAEVQGDSTLWHDPEMWFLSEVLPLIFAGNNQDDTEKVILHKLWEALLSKHIDIDHPSTFKLFPQCSTLEYRYSHIDLSCEAFHWTPKEGEARFLCRSKECYDPQVMPDLTKSYFEYSAFDWLAHYGINYAVEKAPSKRDFSIKLAGYMNRIRELHSRLNCRCCGNLMMPDMKYARVEVKSIDPSTKQVVITPVNAAYRLTVFSCNTEGCKEFGHRYYINHCLHYKCHELIDSRDIKDKCSEGRYICSCGACCPRHTDRDQTIGELHNASYKHHELYKNSPSIQRVRRC